MAEPAGRQPQKESFWSEFFPALLAGETDRIFTLLLRRRGGASGSGSSTSTRTPARGDVDDAYFSLKSSATPAKQQTIWAWIQNRKRTPDGQAAIRRLERDKNTPRIKTMFEQGIEDEWNASIPKSWKEQLGALLPTLDAETQAQIHKTLGGAARRQERRAATLNSPKRFWVGLVIYVVGVLFTLVILFPNWVLFIRHMFVNLFR